LSVAASSRFFVGADRIEPRVDDRRFDDGPIDGVEVDHAAARVGLLTERHQDEAEWLQGQRRL
jgi:hypothetical protein